MNSIPVNVPHNKSVPGGTVVHNPYHIKCTIPSAHNLIFATLGSHNINKEKGRRKKLNKEKTILKNERLAGVRSTRYPLDVSTAWLPGTTRPELCCIL